MDVTFLALAVAFIVIVIVPTVIACIAMFTVVTEHGTSSSPRPTERELSETHLSLYQPSNTDRT